MDTHAASSPRSAMHPMILIAAIAVTLFSAAGIAAIMGWIPTTKSGEPTVTATSVPATAPQAPTAVVELPTTTPVPAPKPVQAPAPQPRPVARAEPAPPKPIAAVTRAPVAQPAPAPVTQVPPPAPRVVCYDCGTIESVRQVAAPGEGTGFGAIAGAIGGGVLGHQVGSGRGRDVGTVVGAIGGAIAGHQVEKQVRKSNSYEIDVRMDDGSVKTFTQDTAPAWRTGDRVHTHNGVLREAS